MREILFRGKRVDNGEWVEGYYYKAKYYRTDKELCDYITIPYPDEENRGSDHFIVIPETVGQYTGLTDKNGKKIFEGDIIKQTVLIDKWERNIISTIEYGVGYAYSEVYGVCQRFRDGSGVSMLSIGDESGMVFCEVIGNIHDNPELLKGENDA